MNNKKQGFVLFECIIYFCLLVVVTGLTFNWAIKTNQTFKARSNLCINHMCTLATQDFLLCQLRSAPAAKNLWKKIDPEQLIWIVKDKDMGLLKTENKLFLMQGSYNQTLQEWKESHKSLISDSIKTLNFAVTTHMIDGIEWIKNISVTHNGTQFLVAIQNGVL